MIDSQGRDWTRTSPTLFTCSDGSTMSAVAAMTDAYLLSVVESMITDQVQQAALDDAIATDATLASLKAMTTAQFDSWWTANVTSTALAIGVLKRLARVVIRRVL